MCDQLRTKFTANVDEFIKLSNMIEERLKLLEEKEKHWQQLEKLMVENSHKASSKIKLDVGGKVYSTTKTNLLKWEGSYFYAMLSSGKWQPDNDGCYFLDMNHKHFDVIMDYLRSGELTLDGLDSRAINKIIKNLDYLQVNLPLKLLQWNPSYCGSKITLSNYKTATKTESDWNGVLAIKPVKSSYTLKIVNIPMNDSMMIGLAPLNNFKPNNANYSSCGWYLHTQGSSLYSQNGDSYRSYAKCDIKNGHTIQVHLDKSNRTISFTINGTHHGVAFNNVDVSQDLFPATELYHNQSSVELILIE